MPLLGRTDSRWRMVAILLVFAVVGVAAGVRLGYWQVVAADELTAAYAEAVRPAEAERTLRADIVDRDGVLLAKTSSYDRLVAHPNLVDQDDLDGLVETLGLLLDLAAYERVQYHEKLADTESEYVRLEQEVSLEQSESLADAIDAGLLPGIALEPQPARSYPRRGGEPGTSLASHLIGFVRADGRGGEGIERYYDDELTVADPGLVDVASLPGVPVSTDGLEPEPLRLTIDAMLQKQVERELNSARVATSAKSASAIVMDPHTGAIVAAASVPGYDAEHFAEVASTNMSKLRNRVFSDQYEPGSVMKIFTVTAALDLGLVTPKTRIKDQRRLDFWEATIRNADHGSKGNLAVKDVIALSRNVATAKLARMLAPNDTQKAANRLYHLWHKVGMTGRTGVDIANEASGNWYDPSEVEWPPVDLANRAFGQGVSVTLPQLARGVSTIVNGGFVVQPHLVADGELASVEKERVLKPKVARQAKEILGHVTGSVSYYAAGALIPGYEIGGKTGTAQIWNVAAGKWKERRFNHSFVGFVGGRKEEYVIAVRLEEPVPISVGQGLIPLRIESYELFQMVARATIKQLDMRKSKDPLAGRPIPGTAAARVLDPDGVREALKQKRQEERRQARADSEGEGEVAKTRNAAADKDRSANAAADKDRSANAAADKDRSANAAADKGRGARSSGGT